MSAPLQDGCFDSGRTLDSKIAKPIGSKYDSPVNRESAYEILSQRTKEKEADQLEPRQKEDEKPSEGGGGLGDLLWGSKRREGMVQALAKQAARTVGSQIGRQIIRGVLGGILGGFGRK